MKASQVPRKPPAELITILWKRSVTLLWFSDIWPHTPVFKRLQCNESKVEKISPSKEALKTCCCLKVFRLMSFIIFLIWKSQLCNMWRVPSSSLNYRFCLKGTLVSDAIVPTFFNGLESPYPPASWGAKCLCASNDSTKCLSASLSTLLSWKILLATLPVFDTHK